MRRPRIALVPYTRGWSYDFNALALQQYLSERFEIEIVYRNDLLQARQSKWDLVVDFWWRGNLANKFSAPVIKQVSSHRWQQPRYGSYDAARLATAFLRRNALVVVPSRRLEAELSRVTDRPVMVCPKGVHPEFRDAGERDGELVVGWAGNPSAADKNVGLLLKVFPALRIAGGSLSQAEMPGWYNGVDVITCASDAEGDPRPLIEAMACGCFVVTVDVGIVPELVIAGDEPIVPRTGGVTIYPRGIVVDRSPQAFQLALDWCRCNLELVRAAGRRNAELMLAERTWAHVAPVWGEAFNRAIEIGVNPRYGRGGAASMRW